MNNIRSRAMRKRFYYGEVPLGVPGGIPTPTPTPTPTPVLLPGYSFITAQYTFNQISGSFPSVSGNAPSWIKYGNLTRNDGKFGKSFLGSVISTDYTFWNLSGNFSFEIWLKVLSTSRSDIFVKTDSNLSNDFGYGFNNGNIFDIYDSVGKVSVDFSSDVLLNQWSHLVVTRNGITKSNSVFWNGVLQGTVVSPNVFLNRVDHDSVILGGNIGSLYVSGIEIDQMRFWNNYLLTNNDAATLYNSNNGIAVS